MGLAYVDYTLPSVSTGFSFSVAGTQTSDKVALGATIPIPTTTGGWFAFPVVKFTTSYSLAAGYAETWTFVCGCTLFDSADFSRLSFASTYMRSNYIGDLQTYAGAADTYTTGLAKIGVYVTATKAGTPSPMTVNVATDGGYLRVMWQTSSGSVPGASAYKDLSVALPAVLNGGADGIEMNRIRYRVVGANATSGKFYGLPIGTTVKKYT